ncbi:MULTISPECIES: dihydroxyacetone kinase operon transcriptional regulator DhaR [Serratia]|jgi:transcriptional activator for dhaKLM operon|uniref:dihydroxyacetone kinase operon transcriptional regulator DhaR n=1 Tax=Serratia TaxID=613 RepID=UPI0003584F4B|nr:MULTISPECIES: dihydroxyacetone kinase operon transcriptional regulator DhaR [Serratia]AGQ32920.1 Fis family transcriptional regulator [Serratia liquefaciens ATCC 27592]MBF8106851.1 PTS-dependent dihydroxyacetone kinase operon transcriptional regulator DhaR [Serratia liquefaciens]MBH2811841.1 PTS-dependent dihydroxyacetone kinase operon transcriptional regulator DhaR [Serratia liquefaciens]MCE9939605.1 PTS-dependent dihydroxyacetone kinase operon transcriptional regulator DhaR [Serratia lique
MENTSRWQRLIEGELPPAQRPAPAIYASWLRCRSLMQPAVWKAPHCALGATFTSICQRKNDLLTLGQAALEDACEYMEQRRCLLAILDESGCMLWLCGDVLTRERLQLLGFTPGAYWAEGDIGTNAPSLAASEGHPIQVRGSEHVRQALHDWSFCATPVYDNSGRQRGSIALGCLLADCAAGDLSLTLALAREIGNSLNADGLLAESNRHLNQLYGLLDGVDDGVMAWDHRGYLQYINQRAATLLKLDEQQSQGKPLTQLLTLPALLNRAIAQRQALQHVEVTFESQRQFIATLLTLKPIFDGERCSFIALLHPLERLRQYVSSQLGRVSHSFEQMPSASLEMRRLIRYGQQAAKGQHPILLCGEEGVGKEQLSQAIHNASDRAAGPYIALNCQLLPEAQGLRELLGSDANEEEAGQLSKFELANGGTLYLEQIEYLPMEMQSALLQVLKTGVVMRLNSNRVIPVDVRVIASSAADLPLLVQQNRFRRQLFYSLQAFEIQIPALRQRLSDIPLLVKHHLRTLEQHFQCRFRVDDEVMTQLGLYLWPGNDLELKGVVERTAMMCHGHHLQLADLPEHLLGQQPLLESDPQPGMPLLTLAEMERQAIIRAANVSRGQLNEMAQLLGIGRTTLWRKIKQYQIDIRQFKLRA